MKMWVRSLASLSGLRIWHCRELWCRWQMQLRYGILWLWCRPETVALIRPLAWEPHMLWCGPKKQNNNNNNNKVDGQGGPTVPGIECDGGMSSLLG